MFVYNRSELKDLRRKLRKNQTEAERKLWSIIKGRKISDARFLRQYGVENYILDFYCPALKLAIEVDGGQHNFDAGKVFDRERSKKLQTRGILVLRFWNNEVMNNLPGVYQKISEVIKKRQINPSESPL